DVVLEATEPPSRSGARALKSSQRRTRCNACLNSEIAGRAPPVVSLTPSCPAPAQFPGSRFGWFQLRQQAGGARAHLGINCDRFPVYCYCGGGQGSKIASNSASVQQSCT